MLKLIAFWMRVAAGVAILSLLANASVAPEDLVVAAHPITSPYFFDASAYLATHTFLARKRCAHAMIEESQRLGIIALPPANSEYLLVGARRTLVVGKR